MGLPTPHIVETILWRRLDIPGHDACGLWAVEEGWRLAGTAVFYFAGQPCQLAYAVECDSAWRTRSAQVTGWIGTDAVSITITALPDRRWRLNDVDQGQVTGCIEVDLAFTPATNLIPLRRLALRVGDEAEAPAAWLSIPEMTLERLNQHYRRVDNNHYAYRASDVGYAGTLEVSTAGFVTSYPGLWELVMLS